MLSTSPFLCTTRRGTHARAVDSIALHEPGKAFLPIHPDPTRRPSSLSVSTHTHTHTHTHTRTRKNAQRIPHAAIRLALCARRVRASCTATGRLVRLNLEDDLEPFERTYDGTTCRAGEAAYSGQGKMSRDLVRAPPRGMRRGGEDAPATKYVNIN